MLCRTSLCRAAPVQAAVFLPASLRDIGESAFAGCLHLAHITLPDGLERIGSRAFGSSSLRSVAIPGSVAHVGAEAFAHSQLLASVAFVAGGGRVALRLDIGDRAFTECASLRSVSIPGHAVMGASMFRNCTGRLWNAAGPPPPASAATAAAPVPLCPGCTCGAGRQRAAMSAM